MPAREKVCLAEMNINYPAYEKEIQTLLRPAKGYNGFLCGGGGIANVGSNIWI